MKRSFLHILQLLFLLPFLGFAQYGEAANDTKFFFDLGLKDAKHELSILNSIEEDAVDFWSDQRVFEELLHKKSPSFHQSYLNGKSVVYRQHQIHCGERCSHSEEFSRQIAYYISKGELQSEGEVVYSEKNGKKE